MDDQIDQAQMTVLSAAGYTLIALHPWDAKAKVPSHWKTAHSGKITNPHRLDNAPVS